MPVCDKINHMAQSERTLVEYLVHVSENYSPLDFMLIADHIDKFLYGSLLTLQITILSLLIGILLSHLRYLRYK